MEVELAEHARPGLARKVATGAVLLGLVVGAFEGTVVTSAMPTITRELGGESLYSWVFSGFLLASTLGVLMAGKLMDHFGRKPVFLGAMGLFLIGSATCGLAQSVPALIAFRVLQGLGAGALQPTTMTISSDLYTLRERAAVQGVFTGAWGAANVLGPVIGGWIVMHASWRWVFLVNVPVGVVAMALLHLSFRDPRRQARETDYVGPLLAGASLALALFALEPSRFPPSARLGLGAVTVAACLAVAWQQRGSRAPQQPKELHADPTVRVGVAGGLAAGSLLYGVSAYVPLWMHQRGYTPVLAGVALVPMLVGWSVGSSFGVKVLMRWGMRASVGGSFCLAFLGASLLTAAALFDWGLAATFASLGVLGMGLGPAASTSIIGPQARATWHQRGAVTSAIYATRTLGGSLGVAVLALARGSVAYQFGIIAAITGLAAAALVMTGPRSLTQRLAEETPAH
jgi:predicted MFS family arabinose efflux permease